MRKTILGYDQNIAWELGLQIVDLHFLIWLRDFAPYMVTIKEGNDIYYWVNAGKFISDYKILNIKPQTFRKYVIKRLIKAHVIKSKKVLNCEELKGHQPKGWATFYAYDDNYIRLLGENVEKKQEYKSTVEKKEGKPNQKNLQNQVDKNQVDKNQADKSTANNKYIINNKDINIIKRENREGWEPLKTILPSLVIDCAFNSTLSLEKLIKAYQQSEFLCQTVFHTSKIISLYDKIVSGYYNNFNPNKSKDNIFTRTYSSGEIENILSDIDSFNFY